MSPAPPPFADLLAELQRAFASLGVRWFLFGAQAAILYGVARLTADIDVTVELGARSSADLVGGLTEAGFELRVKDIDAFVETTRVLPFVHRASRIPVDVVLAGPGLEEQFLDGAREQIVGDARVPVVAPEDLVAMKVLAGRPRDLDDVVTIVHLRGHALDWTRMRRTLTLLEEALARRDLLSELDRLVRLARGAEPSAGS